MNAHTSRNPSPAGKRPYRTTNAPGGAHLDFSRMKSLLAAFLDSPTAAADDEEILRQLFRRLLDATERREIPAVFGYSEASRQLLARFGDGEHLGPVNMAGMDIEIDAQMELWEHFELAVTHFCLEVLWAHREMSSAN